MEDKKMKAYYYNTLQENFFIATMRYYNKERFPGVVRLGLCIRGTTSEYLRVCERRITKGKILPKEWRSWEVEGGSQMEKRK